MTTNNMYKWYLFVNINNSYFVLLSQSQNLCKQIQRCTLRQPHQIHQLVVTVYNCPKWYATKGALRPLVAVLLAIFMNKRLQDRRPEPRKGGHIWF